MGLATTRRSCGGQVFKRSAQAEITAEKKLRAALTESWRDVRLSHGHGSDAFHARSAAAHLTFQNLPRTCDFPFWNRYACRRVPSDRTNAPRWRDCPGSPTGRLFFSPSDPQTRVPHHHRLREECFGARARHKIEIRAQPWISCVTCANGLTLLAAGRGAIYEKPISRAYNTGERRSRPPLPRTV